MKPGPSRNVQSLIAASATPTAPTPAPVESCCCMLTTPRTLTRPIAMKVDSMMTGGDVAERKHLALPPEDREQDHGGGDVCEDQEQFQRGSHEDARVAGAGARDVAGGVAKNRFEQIQRGDRRDEGDDEQHPGGERNPSIRGHVGLLTVATRDVDLLPHRPLRKPTRWAGGFRPGSAAATPGLVTKRTCTGTAGGQGRAPERLWQAANADSAGTVRHHRRRRAALTNVPAPL